MNKLGQNISCLYLLAHTRIGNGKAATREMRCVLCFRVKRDCFIEIAFLAIRGGENRIEIKVIWIKLERSLAFDNCVVNAVVAQVGGGSDVADDGRHRI